MKLQRHPKQHQVHRQSEELRLLSDLNATFEKIFVKAGRRFVAAKTEAENAAIKTEAIVSISQTVIFWKRMRGADAVSRALNSLHLSEYDV